MKGDKPVISEAQAKEIGYHLVKQFDHDQFKTNRYANGILEVEFTYEGGELVSFDLTIPEINSMEINMQDLKVLTQILTSKIN